MSTEMLPGNLQNKKVFIHGLGKAVVLKAYYSTSHKPTLRVMTLPRQNIKELEYSAVSLTIHGEYTGLLPTE